MEVLEKRRTILQSLLHLERPASEVRKELAIFPWDCQYPLVRLTRAHLRSILTRFLAGTIRAQEVEAWADLVEMRDDIDFDEDDQILDIVFVLANSDINGSLDTILANRLLDQISN